MRRGLLLGSIGLLAAAPAAAEVKSSGPSYFEIEAKAFVAATPTATYETLGRVGEWWNPDHTHSGLSTNLQMALQAGGCFCEAMEGGGTVEHMRIVYAEPGETLRLQGGLGPLQAEAVTGVLTWSLKLVEGGTEITQSYVVSGHVRGGADKLAPIVDRVLAEQLEGLRARLSR